MNFKQRIQQQFSRAAAVYDQHATLQYQCAQDLALHLPELPPQRMLDLGTGTGYGLRLLQKKYPQASSYGLDLSHTMLLQTRKKYSIPHFMHADFDHLPLAAHSMDIVFSNLALQWSPALRHSLAEIQRILTPQGTLLFSTLTAGSLTELKARHFLSETAIFDALDQSGFQLKAHTRKIQHCYFSSAQAALRSLKNIGANALADSTCSAFNTRSKLQDLEKNYPCTDQGYPLSYHILYVTARRRECMFI